MHAFDLVSPKRSVMRDEFYSAPSKCDNNNKKKNNNDDDDDDDDDVRLGTLDFVLSNFNLI